MFGRQIDVILLILSYGTGATSAAADCIVKRRDGVLNVPLQRGTGFATESVVACRGPLRSASSGI